MTTFLSNRDIYTSVVCGIVPQAKERLWIATADIKDMYVDAIAAERSEGRAKRGDSRGASRVPSGREMVPFLEVLDGMVKRGVEVRLIHAKDPGPNWRDDFDRYPTLWTAMERMLCPRVHFKCIIVDGVKAYFGSANLTGAGMGAKSEKKRNFENGVLTDDPALVEPLVEQFDSVWRGAFCRDCGRSALGFASAIPSRCSALTSFGGYATSAAIRSCRYSRMATFSTSADGEIMIEYSVYEYIIP